jgi:spore coat polysaccharide biosynthesis protein SpsF
MKVEIYVQARMGSTRLPGKVLMPVLGKPLLSYLVERLRKVTEADAIAILTTTQKEDDLIVNVCKELDVLCYRGPEDDVLQRYYQVAKKRRPDTVVRITADCPLMDPAIVDEVINTFRSEWPQWDYISNSFESTFPRGMDVEVFSFAALEKAALNATTAAEHEHVTPYIYGHRELFRMRNVSCNTNLSNLRLTVDTPEDFHLIKLIFEHLYPENSNFRLRDIVHLLNLNPDWEKINAHIKQKSI